MASSQIMSLSRRSTTPIELYWTLDDGEDEPKINLEKGELRDLVFESYDTDSVDEVAETVFSEYERTTLCQRQLGVVLDGRDGPAFVTDAEALATVDGIDDEIAAKLVDWYGDIPGLCKEMRRDQYLSALKHDAYVEAENEEDAEWVEDVDSGPELERRLKEAGVWTEPTDVVA
jgi:hypothetical protein